MDVTFLYGKEAITLEVPDDSIVYESHYPEPEATPAQLVHDALARPVEVPSLLDTLRQRGPGNVVIVVSDITRPIPYAAFLPELLETVEGAGVPRKEILILVATGMHRPSTADERVAMFGSHVASEYRIVDHAAQEPSNLVQLAEKSWSGNVVHVDRRYMEAGFRIVTGLVEPHFMAGFSGGPKVVCPGLASLHTIRQFHGYAFLADPRTRNGNLAENPCHQEALSVARLAGADFSLNIVLDQARNVVKAYAGELEAAHKAACDFVRRCACPNVRQEADIAITSCGGYPLDATFYQCVKGMVSCLPAVKRGGAVIAFGGCSEGVGGPEYTALMEQYANRWEGFLGAIQQPATFVKDQWEFQMQCRAIQKLGQHNLFFITDGLSKNQLDKLSVNGVAAVPDGVVDALRNAVRSVYKEGRAIAAFPEGPYCAPLQ